jgi:hypothetical protein
MKSFQAVMVLAGPISVVNICGGHMPLKLNRTIAPLPVKVQPAVRNLSLDKFLGLSFTLSQRCSKVSILQRLATNSSFQAAIRSVRIDTYLKPFKKKHACPKQVWRD